MDKNITQEHKKKYYRKSMNGQFWAHTKTAGVDGGVPGSISWPECGNLNENVSVGYDIWILGPWLVTLFGKTQEGSLVEETMLLEAGFENSKTNAILSQLSLLLTCSSKYESWLLPLPPCHYSTIVDSNLLYL